MSDLHLEFSKGFIDLPILQNENDSILILAGDVGIASKAYTYIPFLEEMSERFQDIIFILGNHCHYHGSFIRSLDKIKEEIRDNGTIHNVHVGDNFTVQFDDVVFICTTLWTNMDNCNALTMFDARQGMNDYRIIRTGPSYEPYQRRLTPSDTIAEHSKSKNFIFSSIEQHKEMGKKCVVVTHMGPSFQSVADHYRSSKLNGAYVSNLEEDIIRTEPDLWIHGHVHTSCDYMVGNTRVIVNPRGYCDHEENSQFDPNMVIEV